MIGIAFGAGRPASPRILTREAALIDLDFTTGAYRYGAHRTRVFTDLPGVHFSRSAPAQISDSTGQVLTFPPDTPRITDQGLFIGPGEMCWLDLDAPMDALCVEISFDRSSFYKGSGYRRALQVVSTTRPGVTAALYNDTTQDNVVRYRVDQDGAYVLGPANLPVTDPVARMSLRLSPERSEVRTENSVVTGPGVMDLAADRFILGSEGAFAGIAQPSLLENINEIRIY